MSGTGTAAQAWADTVAACTVGVERAGTPILPGGLGVAAAGAEAWLLAAAALTAWRTAGSVPGPGEALLVEPMPETLPECSDAAAARLELILSDRGPRTQVCREWCRLVATAGLRAPAGSAGKLYAYSRKLDWVAEADQVLGARLPWLRSLQGAAIPGPAETDWTGPDLARRVAALHGMRADPAAGRAALDAVWKTEPADARTKLLAALETGLCADDEPFLEERLDDRSGQVRAEAARLLAALPGSGWVGRMQARAQAAVQFRPGRLLSRATVAVTIPPVLDKAAQRDGLEIKEKFRLGAAMLRQVVSAAPLAIWGAAAPKQWIAAAMGGEWAFALTRGWADAAVREGDPAWKSALLDALAGIWSEQEQVFEIWGYRVLETVAPTVPPPELERVLQPTLRRNDRIPASNMELCRHAWSPAFTRAAMEWLATKPANGSDYPMHRSMEDTLGLMATQGSVDSTERLAVMAAGLPDDVPPALRRAFDSASTTLRFRQAMHQEFAR